MRDDQNNAVAPPSRLALYLSALVYPGAGQFAQKRWLAGIFYACLFSICFIFLVIAIFEPIFSNLRFALELADTGKSGAFRPISFVKMFLWLGISILVYATGLLDTHLSYRRECRRRMNARFAEMKKNAGGQD
jgi:hypothetical protein